MKRPTVLRVLFAAIVIAAAWGEEDTCMRDNDPEVIRQSRIEAVKRDILLKLNMLAPPNNPPADVPVILDQAVLDEYKALVIAQEARKDGRGGCTQYNQYAAELLVFFPTEARPVYSPHGPHHISDLDADEGIGAIEDGDVATEYRLKFQLDLQSRDLITEVELILYKKPSRYQPDAIASEERVEIYLVTYPDNFFGLDLSLFMTAKYISSSTDGFAVFDIKPAIQRWIDLDVSNLAREIELKVLIRCPESTNAGIHFLPSIEFDVQTNVSTQLVVTTYNLQSGEQKRAPRAGFGFIDNDYCKRTPQEFNCCWKRLEINFMEDFGWTWVIQPKAFLANYCEGLCPQFYGPANDHSILVGILAEQEDSALSSPCCIPNELGSLSLQMHVDDTIVIEILEDVRVLQCICSS